MTEKDIERKFGNLVRQRGGLTYKFTSPNNSGVPDRVVIPPGGEVWFVELKADAGKLSEIQRWQIRKLTDGGANVRVLRGWDAAKGFLDEVMPGGI